MNGDPATSGHERVVTDADAVATAAVTPDPDGIPGATSALIATVS